MIATTSLPSSLLLMDEEDIYAGLEIDYATGTVALSRGEVRVCALS